MKIFLFLLLLTVRICVTAQVAVNATGANPSSSAMLDVSSTTKGMLMPRMTTAQRKAVSSPEAGLLVYDLDRQTPYLFDGSQWRPLMFTSDEQLPLIERNPESDDPGAQGWGTALAAWQDEVVVGAANVTVGQNTFQGAAYVYKKVNGVWKVQQKLVAPDGVHGDLFGESVALSQDLLAVGSPNKTINGKEYAGCVYIFKRTGNSWVWHQTLSMFSPAAFDYFGRSLKMFGTKLVAGVPSYDYNGVSNSGSVFYYEFLSGQFSLVKQFAPQTPVVSGIFGTAVALTADRVAVGYPGYNWPTFGVTGAVNVYTYQPASGTWKEELIRSDKHQPEMEFGTSIAMEGDAILVGAPGTDYGSANNAGCAELHKLINGTWVYFDNLFTQVPGDRIGEQLDMHSGNWLVAKSGLDGSDPAVLLKQPGKYLQTIRDIHKLTIKGFGRAIALYGDIFAIAGLGANGAGSVQFGFLP